MSDHNQAIAMAQRVIRQRADGLGKVEVGYNQLDAHPDARGLLLAAKILDALIIPDEPRPAAGPVTAPAWSCANDGHRFDYGTCTECGHVSNHQDDQ